MIEIKYKDQVIKTENIKVIDLLKEEIENYMKQINTLRGELKKFDEYKRLKEEEINTLKIQQVPRCSGIVSGAGAQYCMGDNRIEIIDKC